MDWNWASYRQRHPFRTKGGLRATAGPINNTEPRRAEKIKARSKEFCKFFKEIPQGLVVREPRPSRHTLPTSMPIGRRMGYG